MLCDRIDFISAVVKQIGCCYKYLLSLCVSAAVLYGHGLVTLPHAINKTCSWLKPLAILVQNHSDGDSTVLAIVMPPPPPSC